MEQHQSRDAKWWEGGWGFAVVGLGLFLLVLVLGVAGCGEGSSEWCRLGRELAGWSSVEASGMSTMLRV